jgi:L-alanine-DL-glutamate epimerase-like enolase superfamily enzyme
MVLQWHIIKLQLKEVFSISYGDYNFREALIVRLSHAGYSGFGECTAINYYQINLAEFKRLLAYHESTITAFGIDHPCEFYSFLCHLQLPDFLKSALDCAYWDLYGKLEKRSFVEMNGISTAILPQSSWTISVAPVEMQMQKMQASAWPKFKVKCNGFDPVAIQTIVDSGFPISLDSNASFTPTDCLRLPQIQGIERIQYAEQPMPVGYENYRHLTASDSINWMADEEAQHVSDLVALQPYYQSVNVKVMKCGGLTPALEMVRTAKAMGFQVMLGCMTESTVGISAGAVLAPLCDFADLDGSNLIANDCATGTQINNGNIELALSPGLGIQLK